MAGPWERYSTPAPWERFGGGRRIGSGEAFLSGAADTVSFGWGDELQGWGAGALSALGGGDFSETADRVTSEARRHRALAEAQHGGAFMAGQIGGALVGGGGLGLAGRAAMRGIPALARVAQGTNWAGRMGAAGASGAGGGALYGAGSGDAGNRAESALGYGVLGGLGGAGFSALGSLVGPHLGNIVRGVSPRAAAADVMGQALAREGLTDDQFAKRLAEHAGMGRGGMVLDALGESGAHVAMGAGIKPSAGRRVLKEAMDARQQAVGPRAEREVWEELIGGDPENVAQFIIRMDRTKRAEAAPLYAQAWAEIGRVDPREMKGAVGELMRRHPDIFNPAKQRAERLSLAETGKKIADQSDPRYWHYLLQGAERELGARLRAASMGDLQGFAGPEAALYSRAVRQLNDQIRRRFGPTFRKAQDTYAGANSAQEAAELGYTAMTGKLNTLHLGALQQRVKRMSAADRDAFRAAAANNLQDTIANATRKGANRADVLRGIVGTEGTRRVLEAVFGERGLQTLLKRFDYDRTLLQNSINTGIRVNSITAPAQASARTLDAAVGAPGSAGGVINRLFGPQLQRQAERQGEAVSDRVLSFMAMPADEALARLRQPKRGLLSRAGASDLFDDARARREELMRFRENALADTAFGGLYTGAFSESIMPQFGVQR